MPDEYCLVLERLNMEFLLLFNYNKLFVIKSDNFTLIRSKDYKYDMHTVAVSEKFIFTTSQEHQII